MQSMSERPNYYIFSRYALDQMRKSPESGAKRVDLMEQRFGPPFTFPDGSVMLLTSIDKQKRAQLWSLTGIGAMAERELNAVIRRMMTKSKEALPGAISVLGYRSLACFAPADYSLLYTTDYQYRTDEECGIYVYPLSGPRWTPAAEVTQDEQEPSKLLVTVSFRGRVTAAMRQAFVAAIAAWAATVAEGGIAGQGPARVCPPGVQFRGEFARFEIDASASGQNTLNWLTLCLLNFGYTVLIVERITYCARDRKLRQFEEEKGETITMPWPAPAAALELAKEIVTPINPLKFPPQGKWSAG